MLNKDFFSKKLSDLRRNKAISQQSLADYLGVGKSAISMMENGQRAASADVLISLANYFKVPVDYLIGQGLYGKEDIIEQHFSEIIKISKDWFAGYFNDSFWDMLSAADIITKIQILSDLYKDISIDTDGTLVLYPNIPKKEEK